MQMRGMQITTTNKRKKTNPMKTTLTDLIKSTNIPLTLVRAVVRQMGGWESFKENAPDITRHGIAGGFGGFIYYSDTVAFTKRNRRAIMQMASEQANEFGVGLVEMIKGFNCLKGVSEMEVVQGLSGSTDETNVPNALAWYAGEEVSRAYCDLIERQ